MKLLSRILHVWTGWIISWPRLALLIAFLTAFGSVAFTATKLEMITDQLELIRKDHPLIALSDKLDPFTTETRRRFDVVIEAPSPSRAVAFVNELSKRIATDPAHFQNMFYRVDPEPFKEWQLLYLDAKDLTELKEKMASHETLLQGFAKSPELLNFLKLLNQEMASRMVGEFFTGFLDDGSPEGKSEPFDLSFLIDTLEGMSSYLHGHADFKSPWTSLLKGSSWDPDLEGYFWEANKRYLIAFVIPTRSKGEVVITRDSLDQLRKHMQEIRAAFPDVKAGVTGQEALNNDEMNAVLDDMSVATWLSILGIFILLVAFRKSFRRPLFQTVSLAVGLSWSFGFATLFVGHLNMISIVFAPLLCGLGVDSGIHWFSRLEEEERRGDSSMATVITRVNDRSGPGIILAALGTTIAFLPFILTGFRGLMELGFITGMGIALNLIADFTVLPALTFLLGGKSRKDASLERESGVRDLIRLNPGQARAVLSGAAVVTALCILTSSQVHFDLNPLRLQTANAESVIWGKNLIENSQRSTIFASSFASSPEELTAKKCELEALPSVREVESVFSLLPENQESKIPLLRSIQPKIPKIHPAVFESKPSDFKDLTETLERIRFKLQDDKAEQWGAEKPLLEQMVRVRALAQDITQNLQSSPGAMKNLDEYRERFLQDLVSKWDTLQKGVSASPMRVEDLPETLRGWFYQNGTYLLRIFPKESVWEEYALTKFVRELQRVDPQVIGDPVSLFVFASAFREACIKAAAFAVIAIIIVLLITFRDIRLTLLALVPVMLGSLWTVGIMGVANIQFNLANSIFMPLVVGAGVEYAVIILSRWREGRMLPGHLPFSTGKGVILAALTTTVGFGALMISHHRGIFSLGFISWAGSLCVLLSALYVLPAILARMAPARAPTAE
ncbi:MAG: MMPL family transporter [Syntrophobacteraceae bacterium]